MVTYVLFVIGFVFLVKGADFLVDGAAAMAKKLKISNIVIGLTVVSFGTSAPELFVNVIASLGGSPQIAIGNILGSNIANILLILGVAGALVTLEVKPNTIRKEVPYSLLGVIILTLMVNDKWIDGAPHSQLSHSEGWVLLAFFAVFMYYTYSIAQRDYDTETAVKHMALPWSLTYIGLGIIGLTFGGEWIVDGAVKIAKTWHISESFIALTIVSIGTSLPELATSVMAALKRNADIAVGNVVGSNIFNILWVLGISAAIKPIDFHPQSNIDIGMTLLATFLLFIFVYVGKKHKIERWQGALFIVLYVLYLTLLITLETLPESIL